VVSPPTISAGVLRQAQLAQALALCSSRLTLTLQLLFQSSFGVFIGHH